MQLYVVAPLIYQVLSLSSESFHNGWCLQKRDLVNDLKILLETTILLIIHLDNLFGINMGKTSQRKGVNYTKEILCHVQTQLTQFMHVNFPG